MGSFVGDHDEMHITERQDWICSEFGSGMIPLILGSRLLLLHSAQAVVNRLVKLRWNVMSLVRFHESQSPVSGRTVGDVLCGASVM